MNKHWFQKGWPHLAAVAIFLVVSVIYCAPVLRGEVVEQHDFQRWKAMAQKSYEFKEKYGHYPLWSNSMFAGMPAYQIIIGQTHPVTVNHIYSVLTLGLPKPISFFFLACLSFYILALILPVRPWIGVLSALAYAYSTYDPIIVEVGHDTKMQAIAMAPAVIGGFLLLFRKQYWGGAMMLAVALSLQMSTVHLQIVYYTLIIAGIIALFHAWQAIRAKEWGHLLLSGGIGILIALVCMGTSAVTTLTTYDYAKYSIRGGESEMKDKADPNTTAGGLDKEYAFRWSYGIGETLTLIHPTAYGGGSAGKNLKSSVFAQKLTEIGYPEETALQVANGSTYWGPQPGTSGPVYLGAVIVLLFIIGLFAVRSWHLGWIVTASLFGIILAWGNHFEAVNYFLFDYLPFYKKFRAPTMALVIPQLCFAVMAAFTLQEIFFGKREKAEWVKILKRAGITTGALIAVLLAFYASATFSGNSDAGLRDNFSNMMLQQAMRGGQQPGPEAQMQAQQFASGFVDAIQEDRKSMYLKDMLRNTVLIGLSFLLIWLFVQGKIKSGLALASLTIISSLDLLGIANRYLDRESYVDESTYENTFAMTQADAQIKQDTGYYRVFNQTVPPFDESLPSYYHNTIGGYHPAKLAIFQDLYEQQLSKGNMQAFNMLNTKYFIVANPQDGKPIPQINSAAFGHAWLVKHILYVKDGKDEMKAMDSINLRDTAIVQDKFKPLITAAPQMDSTASIRLVENRNDDITYDFNAATPQFAVFSEIYYPGGWKATIDDKPAEIIKVNYALRGLSVPAGKHTIKFHFDPDSYRLGNTLVLWSSIFVYVLLILGGFMLWRRSKKTA